MTTMRPPRARDSTAAGTARSRTSSSSLTSIRKAWKVRLAGCPPDLAAEAGTTERICSTSSPVVVNSFTARAHDPVGDPAGELLLAPFADDPYQVFFAVGIDHVRGSLATAGVHAHVQWRVEGVGESPLTFVKLQGGDTQIHEDSMYLGHAEVGQDILDLVIHRVDQVSPRCERCQPLPGECQGFLVAVNADEVEVREPLEHGLRVAAHAQRGVDGNGGFAAQSRRLESRCQQINAPVAKDRYMAFGRGLGLIGHALSFPAVVVPCCSWDQIPIRAYRPARLAPGKVSQVGSRWAGWRSHPRNVPAAPSGIQRMPGMGSSVSEKAVSFSARYSFQAWASQISARVPAPMTASSLPSPAYSRSAGGIVTRPCLSGTSSEAPERKTRM